MLHRSLGSSSFAGFWRYWNPIFGYCLGRYVYAPLQRWLPAALALVMTFVACGALHDLVTMAVRGSLAFLFMPWFFFLGLGVVLGRAARMDLSAESWLIRALANLAYIGICLAAALVVKSTFGRVIW